MIGMHVNQQFLFTMLIKKKLNCHLFCFRRQHMCNSNRHAFILQIVYRFACFYVNLSRINRLFIFTFLDKAHKSIKKHIALCVYYSIIAIVKSVWSSKPTNQVKVLSSILLWQHIIIYNLCEINCVQLEHLACQQTIHSISVMCARILIQF